MPSSVCQHCRLSFRTESIQFDGFSCPNCGEQVGARVDREVADSRSSADFDRETASDEFVEVIQFSFLYAMARSVWSAIVTATLLAAVIVSMFIAINVFAAIDDDPQRILALPRAGLIFFGFSWCFLALVAFPVAFFMSWLSRPRRICVDEDELIINTAGRTHRMQLAECFWYVTKMGFDTSSAYFPQLPLIIIQQRASTLDRGQKPLCFACGFSDHSFQMWSDFFTATCVNQPRENAATKFFLAAIVGTTLGGTLGALLGLGIEAIAGIPFMAAAVGFLGWLDGGVAALLWYSLGMMQKQDFEVWFKRQMSPVTICMVFAVIGLKVGILAGWDMGITIAVVNSLIGLVIYLYLRKAWLQDTSQLDDDR